MRRTATVLLTLVLVLSIQILTSSSHAQGGSIAVSGSFSGWEFEIPQGSEVGSLERFLVVFNNTGETLDFTPGFRGPPGVEVEFSVAEFTLEPGTRKRIFVIVKASQDAIPGEYDLFATVTAGRTTPTGGIGVAAEVTQKARVTVIGESALVDITVTSPQSQPVVAQIGLFRAISDRESEVAYSDSGVLNAKVSPGRYIARVHVGGAKLAEESFTVAADETKIITFAVRTVFLSDVNITPRYRADTTEISFATLEYTLTNSSQSVAAVEVILNVTKVDTPTEEATILTLDILDVGSTSGSHNYIPAAGWNQGLYSFRIDLFVGGELYTTSLETDLVVDLGASPSPDFSPDIGTPMPTTTLTSTIVATATPTAGPISTRSPVPTATVSAAPSPTTEAGQLPASLVIDLSSMVSEIGIVLDQISLKSQDLRATIEIPKGTTALSLEGEPLTRIEILEESQPYAPPADASILGAVYNLSPNGATFSPPIELRLGFDPVIFSLGVSKDDLAIIRYQNQQEWVRLDSIVDTEQSLVTAQTSHFTQFALVAFSNPSSSNWPIIAGVLGGVAAAVLILGGGVAYRARRRRA